MMTLGFLQSVLLMTIHLGAFKLLAAQVPYSMNGWTSSLFNIFLSGVVLFVLLISYCLKRSCPSGVQEALQYYTMTNMRAC